AVAADGGNQEEKNGGNAEANEHAAVAWTRKVNREDVRARGLFARVATGEPAAKGHEKQPQNEKAGRNYIGEDAHVGVGAAGKEIDGPKQKEREDGGRGENRAAQDEPIAEDVPARGALTGCISHTSCALLLFTEAAHVRDQLLHFR